MEIILDLDGVLVDLIGGVCKALKRPDIHEKSLRGEYNVYEKDFKDALDLTSDQLVDLFHQRGKDFWLDLGRLQGFERVINLVHSYSDSVTVCSMICETIWCSAGKAAWMKSHMPGYNYILTTRGSDDIPLKSILAGPNRVLIDDSPSNCKWFVANGGYAINYCGYTDDINAAISRLEKGLVSVKEDIAQKACSNQEGASL